jgi:hypothetical protein
MQPGTGQERLGFFHRKLAGSLQSGPSSGRISLVSQQTSQPEPGIPVFGSQEGHGLEIGPGPFQVALSQPGHTPTEARLDVHGSTIEDFSVLFLGLIEVPLQPRQPSLHDISPNLRSEDDLGTGGRAVPEQEEDQAEATARAFLPGWD